MKKETRIMTIATSVIIIFIGMILSALPNAYYKKAEEMYSKGKYEEARDIYIGLGDYKDARMQANTVSLVIADRYVDEENYGKALIILSTDDTDPRMRKMYHVYSVYVEVLTDYHRKKYEDALQELEKIMEILDEEKEIERSTEMKKMIIEAMNNNDDEN